MRKLAIIGVAFSLAGCNAFQKPIQLTSWTIAPIDTIGWMSGEAVIANPSSMSNTTNLDCKVFDAAGVILGASGGFYELDAYQSREIPILIKPTRPDVVRQECKVVQ